MLYSHKFDDGTKLELKRHLEDVGTVSRGIIQQKQLSFSLSPEIINDISFIISICHDFGKATDYFQERLDNKNIRSSYTNHSLLSAMAGFSMSMDYIESRTDLDTTWRAFIPLMVFFIIERHHINLGDLSKSKDKPEQERHILVKQLERIDNSKIQGYIFGHNDRRISFLEIKEKLNKNLIELIENKLNEQFVNMPNLGLQHIFLLYFLFSILMEADKAKLILGERDRHRLITIDSDLVDLYKQSRQFEGSKKIIGLREKAYKEISNKAVTLDLGQKIYSITLPTGFGKTLASLSFALKLRERIKNETMGSIVPKIIYSLPYLSIIDQTETVFNDVFKDVIKKYGNKALLKDHSLGDVLYKTNNLEELDANRSEFLISSWDAEIILTTVDRLFYSFFNVKREYILKFHNLFNSIIILDEVQNISDELWLTIRLFFSSLSQIGNSYIIIMTATQPVIFGDADIKEIISDPESYYKDLNRVTIHPCFDKTISLNKFVDIVSKYIKSNSRENVLVVLNTIDSSIQFFKAIKEKFKNKKMIYLSSNIIPKERMRRIREIKRRSKRGKIIIATQCVEAGVDIDVNVVFRDFAPLDSLNQIAGRCNRHYLNENGEVFIYKVIDENSSMTFYSYIYGEVHTAKTEEVLKERRLTENEMFSISKDYFERLRKWHFETRKPIDSMLECKFSHLNKFQRLLRGNDFLKESVFVESDKESKKVLRWFKDADEAKNWKERRNKLLKIRKKLAENAISIYKIGKRGREKYVLSDYINKRFGLNCLIKEHYDKKIGFFPKKRSLIL